MPSDPPLQQDSAGPYKAVGPCKRAWRLRPGKCHGRFRARRRPVKQPTTAAIPRCHTVTQMNIAHFLKCTPCSKNIAPLLLLLSQKKGCCARSPPLQARPATDPRSFQPTPHRPPFGCCPTSAGHHWQAVGLCGAQLQPPSLHDQLVVSSQQAACLVALQAAIPPWPVQLTLTAGRSCAAVLEALQMHTACILQPGARQSFLPCLCALPVQIQHQAAVRKDPAPL